MPRQSATSTRSGSTAPVPNSKLWPAAFETLGSALLKDPRRAAAVAVALVGVIALADSATGYEVRLAVLYLLPVFVASWAAGRLAGGLIAVLATVSWVVMFRYSHPYSLAIYYYWEAAILLGTLLAFVLILTRLRQALQNADRRFVTVLEGLDAAVYVDDMDSGALLYTNRRFRDFFGADAEAGNARDFQAGFDVLPADLFTRAARAPSDSAALKGEFHDRAGQQCFLVHARTVHWTDGRQVSLKVVADVTEARRAEENNRRHAEKLQISAKLIAIGEMASALAHELNQPLTAIASYNQACLQLLRAGSPDPRALRGYMEKCSAQAVRAGSVINRMREFMRKRTPLRSPNDLKAIIAEAVQRIELEAQRSAVAVTLNLAPALPPVLVDAIMVEQVLLNLIRNGIEAMQHTEPGSKLLSITSAHAEPGLLQVSLCDSGHGISAEVAGQLYTAFFSTKENGMGVGLMISRSIVEFHGGKLWHESGAAGGCVFHFSLPVAAA